MTVQKGISEVSENKGSDINPDSFFVSKPCVVSFFIGELGWLIQRWQGYLRYLKTDVYRDREFILMMNTQFHPLVRDFVSYTIDLPQEFYELKLETDCYEAPLPRSDPGALTPPDAYSGLIDYIRNFYILENAVEIWTPRGADSFWISHKQQVFCRYLRRNPPMSVDRPIICVAPRGRDRASFRNVPEHVWKGVVDGLSHDFIVVLCGTPSGSCLSDYKSGNVINLISYNGDDKFEQVMEYMLNSICVVSSQSGLTHVGLMCDRPSYIIGHEQERHAVKENRLLTPVSFRNVPDYRCIDVDDILADLARFFDELTQKGFIIGNRTADVAFDIVLNKDEDTMKNLIMSR